MKRIEISPAETAWTKSPAAADRSGGGGHRIRHKGDEDRPQLFEVRLPPDAHIGVHAHYRDEVIYVVQGSILFGQQTLGVGASLSVPGNVLYSFRAGPEGVHYLNFRVCEDRSSFNREQFEELQKLEGAAREEYVRTHVKERFAQRAEAE